MLPNALALPLEHECLASVASVESQEVLRDDLLRLANQAIKQHSLIELIPYGQLHNKHYQLVVVVLRYQHLTELVIGFIELG